MWKKYKEERGQEDKERKKGSYPRGRENCCYETVPRKKTISHIFFNLVDNIQEYNTRGV